MNRLGIKTVKLKKWIGIIIWNSKCCSFLFLFLRMVPFESQWLARPWPSRAADRNRMQLVGGLSTKNIIGIVYFRLKKLTFEATFSNVHFPVLVNSNEREFRASWEVKLYWLERWDREESCSFKFSDAIDGISGLSGEGTRPIGSFWGGGGGTSWWNHGPADQHRNNLEIPGPDRAFHRLSGPSRRTRSEVRCSGIQSLDFSSFEEESLLWRMRSDESIFEMSNLSTELQLTSI